MSKKQELYSIFKAVKAAASRYKTYPTNYADKLNKIMYKKHQGKLYKLEEGGAPTMQQFFNYGHPTPGLPYIFEAGGQATAAALMAGQQSGQLPMFQMGQSFADQQKNDAAKYGYMAMGGSAGNSTSAFPNEKLGKFIGSVQGKAKTAMEKSIMQSYNAPYTEDEMAQAMQMQAPMPMAAWGGGFDENTQGLDYSKLSKINAKFNQAAPDVRGAFDNLGNALSDQYVKQVTISDLKPEDQYWKDAAGSETLEGISKYQPLMDEIYPAQSAYGGVPKFYGGGTFDKYKTSGTSMLEIKSKQDFDGLLNSVNAVLAQPGRYSIEDVEAARYYNDLINRDAKRITQALNTKGQTVSLNAPGDSAYTANNAEWSVNAGGDPQGKYTWQNNSSAKPTIGVQGNQVVTRGTTKGQPLAVKTGEASYKANPKVKQQQNIQAQDAADQQVRYPVNDFYVDPPLRQYTTNPDEAISGYPTAAGSAPSSTRRQAPVSNWRDNLSIYPEGEEDYTNYVPVEDTTPRPSVMDLDPLTRKMIFDNTPYGGFDVMTGPSGQYMPDRSFANQDEQDLMMMDIAQRNAANDPANAPFMQLDPLSRRMILDNTPYGGYDTMKDANGQYMPDRSFANPDEQALMETEIAQRNNVTPLQAVSNQEQTPPPVPPTKKAAPGETPLIEGKWLPPLEVKASEDDPTAGMTREERLAYHRSKRNLAPNTQMLGEVHAGSKAEKDRIIREHNEREQAKLEQVAEQKAYGGIPKYWPGGPTGVPAFPITTESLQASMDATIARQQADAARRQALAQATGLDKPSGAVEYVPVEAALLPGNLVSRTVGAVRTASEIAQDAQQRIGAGQSTEVGQFTGNVGRPITGTNAEVGPFTGNLGFAAEGEAPLYYGFDAVSAPAQIYGATATAVTNAPRAAANTGDQGKKPQGDRKGPAPFPYRSWEDYDADMRDKEAKKKKEAEAKKPQGKSTTAPSTTNTPKKEEAPSTTTTGGGQGAAPGTAGTSTTGTATTTGTSTTGTGTSTTATTGTGTSSSTPAAATTPATQAQQGPGPARVAAIENKWRWSPFGKVDPTSGKRHGQAKSTRIEFGYGMPAVGPAQAPAATPQQSAQNLQNVFQSQVQRQGPGAGAIITAPQYDHTITADQRAKDAEIAARDAAALARQRQREAASPAPVAAPAVPAASTAEANAMRIPGFAGTFSPSEIQGMVQGAPSTTKKAYGGDLYRFVGGGEQWGIDPTKFNQDIYNEMVAAKGPAPKDMQNPYLVTTAADFDYGRDNADVAKAGVEALTALKQRNDYNKEAAKLPNELSAANIFTTQNTRETGINNARGHYNIYGDLGIGSKDTGMMMSKYGGDENSEGNIYFLDEDTIRQIMAMGGTVEYLD